MKEAEQCHVRKSQLHRGRSIMAVDSNTLLHQCTRSEKTKHLSIVILSESRGSQTLGNEILRILGNPCRISWMYLRKNGLTPACVPMRTWSLLLSM